MESNALTFKKQTDGNYVAAFVSTGLATVQLSRKAKGIVSVRANIPGMNPVPVSQFDNPYSTDIIFDVDMAEGIEVTLISTTEVNDGRIFS